MLAHEQVWTAIDALAERHGMSPSGLARRSGLDPTTFNKSKRYAADGRPRWPSTESISKILKATNTSVTELFAGVTHPVAAAEAIGIPLLGEARAGLDLPVFGGPDPIVVPQRARTVTFPDKRFDPLYALSVSGDSMLPLYRAGDVLFIAPNAKMGPGDRVVVRLRTGDVQVKVLKGLDETSFSFHAVNPEQADVTYPLDDVLWVARIVYASQ